MGILKAISDLNSRGLFSYSVTRDELQEKVEAAFPKAVEKIGMKAKLHSPNVILTNGDDRIGLELNVEVSVPLMGTKVGQAVVMGNIDYRAEESAIYISNAEIVSCSIPGISDSVMKALQAVAGVAVAKQLEATPVHRLESGMATRSVKGVEIKNGKISVALGI